MKATAHWLELKGHTPKSKSTIFDEEFTEQVVATGKIEEGRVIRNFFAKTGQPLHAGLAGRDGEARGAPAADAAGNQAQALAAAVPAADESAGRKAQAQRSRSTCTSRKTRQRKACAYD